MIDDLIDFKVFKEHPHDSQAFTQGLVDHDGILIESTGLKGQSEIRKIELETGKILSRFVLEEHQFGEGITIYESYIYQGLLGESKIVIRDIDSLKIVDTIEYENDVWGITSLNNRIFTSDGSSYINVFSPSEGKIIDCLQVNYQGENIEMINDMQIIGDKIYANIWTTNVIAEIDLNTGNVTGWIDIHNLRPINTRHKPNAVLNGIAYSLSKKTLIITGKFWNKIFEVIIERSNP